MKRSFLIFLGTVLILAPLGLWVVQESKRITSTRPTAWVKDHQADCGIVLTGGAGRVREGFDLLSQKQIKKLIVAGVHPGARLREIFPQWPFYNNLDVEDVILEKRSRTTFGNAQHSLAVVEALHCRDAVLITSRLHMYRAERTFKAVYPNEFPLYFRSIVSKTLRPGTLPIAIETLKSSFYSLWAY